jgi:hypothetical protein
MSCTNHEFKQGQSFAGVATYVPEPGWPANLSGVVIYSALLDARNKKHYFTITVQSPTQFTMSYDNTQDWHSGTAYWDIQFSKDGTVFYSDTIRIAILPNVTPNPVPSGV